MIFYELLCNAFSPAIIKIHFLCLAVKNSVMISSAYVEQKRDAFWHEKFLFSFIEWGGFVAQLHALDLKLIRLG